MNNGKSLGPGGISVELIKYVGNRLKNTSGHRMVGGEEEEEEEDRYNHGRTNAQDGHVWRLGVD